jgi:alpha-galactosidase
MASPADVAEMDDWARNTLAVRDAAPSFQQAARSSQKATVKLIHQDHNELRFGQSIMLSPLCIGSQVFKHGLGTHANSEISIGVPVAAAKFQSWVGIDDNPNTRSAMKSSVQFVVDIDGKEVLRTKTLRCGDPPVAVDIQIPPATSQIVLKTIAMADGAGWDHADWADARLIAIDGRIWQLDETHGPPSLIPEAGLPFSFSYGGKSSGELLKTWPRTIDTKESADQTQYQTTWTDPAAGLRLSADVLVYKQFPAADWVLRFENTGTRDTPVLEGIQALDMRLPTEPASEAATLHRLAGDDCSGRSFLPIENSLPAPGRIAIAPSGGRPSSGAFPFFNLQHGGRGLFVAIGWSGQWAASFDRQPGGATRVCGGMERTHLVLHPGEAIRSPRVLLMTWRGDRVAAHNRFRRLMLFHYVLQQHGRPLAVPICWQNFDRYNARRDWACEAGQIESARLAAKTKCDFLWLDAAWFVGHFPNGVGNWIAKPDEFPRGLRPISDECHRLGLKFIVWFEPERVVAGTQIAREHAEFVHGGASGGLFKLDDPAARRWLTDLLLTRIDQYGMDWYRNDFNIEPLEFWRKNDPPDRQGMTEIRYVEGHYAMWDAMLARRPDLAIDNCASGGRRIDLETIRRSITLWRSDTGCGPGHADWHQAQAMGMNYYLPLHEICAWSPDAYEMRSTSGPGAIVQYAYLEPGFSLDAACQAVAEVRENQKYFYGDFYPLTQCSAEPDQFIAYQMHRPDLNAGLVLAFRRAKCDVIGRSVGLGGINAQGRYEVEFVDEQRHKTKQMIDGQTLAGDLPLLIPHRGESLMVRYRQIAFPAKP